MTFSSGVSVLRALGPFFVLSYGAVWDFVNTSLTKVRQRWNFWTSPSVCSGVSCLPGFITMDDANSSFVSDLSASTVFLSNYFS